MTSVHTMSTLAPATAHLKSGVRHRSGGSIVALNMPARTTRRTRGRFIVRANELNKWCACP